jgi:hypothetical protein
MIHSSVALASRAQDHGDDQQRISATRMGLSMSMVAAPNTKTDPPISTVNVSNLTIDRIEVKRLFDVPRRRARRPWRSPCAHTNLDADYRLTAQKFVLMLRFTASLEPHSRGRHLTLLFCTFMPALSPIPQRVGGFSGVRIQSGVAENPFLPGRMT